MTNAGAIRIWDVLTGKQTRTLVARRSPVQVLAFSPDGQYLAAGFGYTGSSTTEEYDQLVKVWNLASLELVASLEHRNTIAGVSFSPDGKLLASACHDKAINPMVLAQEAGPWI